MKLNPETDARIRLKKWGYLLILVPALLPWRAWERGLAGDALDLWAFWPLVAIFGVVPLLDWLVGRDATNPQAADEARLNADRFYRALPLACVPLQLALVGFGAWVFAEGGLGWAGRFGWVLSLGAVSGVLAINVAHELIHRDTRVEQWAGGVLLSTVCHGSFKVEHIYGHHVNVATPQDGSTARLGEPVYAFLWRAWRDNIPRAWQLERGRLARRGLPALSRHNELIWWWGLSAALTAALAGAFGPAGLAYFLLQGAVGVSLLEVVNYIEHYGLEREKLGDGRYERVTPMHSWNSNFLLTNLMLFELQRHADHHAHAKRRYQLLRHLPESPQLPAGYAAMVLLALAPPLWRRMMDPRVRALRRRQSGASGAA